MNTYVSGSNYFNNEDLQEMINYLEKGVAIDVGIDCIGHMRNNMTQEEYKKALIEYFGDRLDVTLHEGVCSYNYSYRLNDNR